MYNLTEFLLLASTKIRKMFAQDSPVRILHAVVVCFDVQYFYKNYKTLVGWPAEPIVHDEFASYCESKIQRHFDAAAEDHRPCMTVSDLIHMDPWARLYDIIGPRVMKFMLFDCLLLVPVQKNAYFCVRTPSQHADGRHEIARSFLSSAGFSRKAAAEKVRKNERKSTKTAVKSTCFNVASLLTRVKPISQVDADDMFRSIVGTIHGDVDETADKKCFDYLKRKLNVMADKDSLSKYKPIYKNAVRGFSLVAEIPLGRIKKFVAGTIRKTVPRELFGVNRNRDQFCKNLCKVLNGGKLHNYTVQHIVYKIKASKFRWLHSVSDAGRRTEIMAAFLVWLTNSFVFGRIAHFFRIVTTNTPINGVAYYTKAGWTAACREKILPLMDSCKFFKEVSLSRLMCYRGWKVSPLAKPNGVRLIYKLQQKESGAKRQLTDDCLAFLRCLSRTYPVEFRSVSRQQFFHSWRTLHESRDVRLPVYYVRTDFQDAFTSIKQDKLLAVVQDRINESFNKKSQVVHVHSLDALTIGNGGSVYSKKISNICELPAPEFPAGSLVFYHKTSVVPLNRIRDTVKTHVKRNAIKWSSRYWRVTRGIVQGDRLSVALCDLLLADLQAARLKDQSNGLLYRFVDDYVFVSTNITVAQRFLTTMSSGFPEYGLQLNQSKTETNLTSAGDGTFKFLGFRFNAVTGEVTKDMGVYWNKRPLPFFNQELGRGRPGRTLYAKMTRVNQLSVPVMLVTKSFNSASTAARNLASAIAFRAFAVVTAIKQYFFHLNTVFVVKMVHAVAKLVYAKMCSLVRCTAITPMQSKWITFEVYSQMIRKNFLDADYRILWILDRIHDLQTATGQKCNTVGLKVALRRYNFTNMFG